MIKKNATINKTWNNEKAKAFLQIQQLTKHGIMKKQKHSYKYNNQQNTE